MDKIKGLVCAQSLQGAGIEILEPVVEYQGLPKYGYP